jgi:hypothetical protein
LEEGKKKRHVSEGNASVGEEILSEATNLQQMAAEGGGGEIAAPEKAERRHQEDSIRTPGGSFTKARPQGVTNSAHNHKGGPWYVADPPLFLSFLVFFSSATNIRKCRPLKKKSKTMARTAVVGK